MARRQILLVRHCESQANAEGRIEGRGDSPLSEEGLRQAEKVAALIAARGIGDARLATFPHVHTIGMGGCPH